MMRGRGCEVEYFALHPRQCEMGGFVCLPASWHSCYVLALGAVGSGGWKCRRDTLQCTGGAEARRSSIRVRVPIDQRGLHRPVWDGRRSVGCGDDRGWAGVLELFARDQDEVCLDTESQQRTEATSSRLELLTELLGKDGCSQGCSVDKCVGGNHRDSPRDPRQAPPRA